jgi:hypothetical protein
MASFLLPLIPIVGFLFSGFSGILSVAVLEEHLVASRHEVEGAHLREGFSGKDHHEAWLPKPGGGLILVDDSIAATEATTAIVRVKGGLHNHG